MIRRRTTSNPSKINVNLGGYYYNDGTYSDNYLSSKGLVGIIVHKFINSGKDYLYTIMNIYNLTSQMYPYTNYILAGGGNNIQSINLKYYSNSIDLSNQTLDDILYDNYLTDNSSFPQYWDSIGITGNTYDDWAVRGLPYNQKLEILGVKIGWFYPIPVVVWRSICTHLSLINNKLSISGGDIINEGEYYWSAEQYGPGMQWCIIPIKDSFDYSDTDLVDSHSFRTLLRCVTYITPSSINKI